MRTLGMIQRENRCSRWHISSSPRVGCNRHFTWADSAQCVYVYHFWVSNTFLLDYVLLRDRRVHVAVRGNHRDGQPGVVGVDLAYQFDAVAIGKVHVRQTQVELVRWSNSVAVRTSLAAFVSMSIRPSVISSD